MPPDSAPDPDIVAAELRPGDHYLSLGSILIIIDTFTADNANMRDIRRSLYAGHYVPEYRAVELDGARIHQYWNPTSGNYERSREHVWGDCLPSATMPHVTVETAGIV